MVRGRRSERETTSAACGAGARSGSPPVRPHVEEMLLAWRLLDEGVDTVFDGAIGHGEAIVLAQVFRPRSHQERLQVSAGNLGVGEEVPAHGAIAAPDFFERPHGGLELARLAGSDEVFEGHQDRAVVEAWLHGQPSPGPATPGAEGTGR